MKKFLPSITFFLLLFLIIITALPLQSFDLFWHLATGRYIIEENFPKVDPFTVFARGTRWIASGWLFDVGVYFLYILGGFSALFFLKILIYFILFIILYLYLIRAQKNFIALVISLFYFYVFIHQTVLLSPRVFTFIFSALILILSEKPSAKNFSVIAFIFLIWTNTHPGYMMGVLLFFIFYNVKLKNKIIYTAALVLVCLINPNGYKLLIYPFSYLGYTRHQIYIQEWQGLFYKDYVIWLFIFFYYFPAVYFKRFTRKNLAVSSFFLILSVYSKRYLPFFALVTLKDFFLNIDFITYKYLFLYNLKERYENLTELKLREAAALLGAVIVLSLIITPVNRAEFPFEASRELKNIKARGNILTYFRWGGFIEFENFNALRPLIDGRMPLFSEKNISDFKKMIYDFNRGVLNKYEIDYILLRPDHKNIKEIQDSFEVIFKTENEILIKRITKEN